MAACRMYTVKAVRPAAANQAPFHPNDTAPNSAVKDNS